MYMNTTHDTTARPKVAFICVHNSCRSQIAEALARHFAGDVFESYSAGTDPGGAIDPNAVRLVKQGYGIDMATTQRPKLISEIPPVDVVITMGCNVHCPTLPCKWREDWGIDDPRGRSDHHYAAVIARIEAKVKELARRPWGAEPWVR